MPFIESFDLRKFLPFISFVEAPAPGEPHCYIIKRIYQMLYLHQTADGLIHECNGEQIIANDKSTYLVWTKCEIDVPENKSLKSNEVVTCYKCLQA